MYFRKLLYLFRETKDAFQKSIYELKVILRHYFLKKVEVDSIGSGDFSHNIYDLTDDGNPLLGLR
jgi:hypothetical protein